MRKLWPLLLVALAACSSEPPKLKTDLDYCSLLKQADLGGGEWDREPTVDGPDACNYETLGPSRTSSRVEIIRDTTVEDQLAGSGSTTLEGEETTKPTLRGRQVHLTCVPQSRQGGNCSARTEVSARTVLFVGMHSLSDDYRDMTIKATEKVLNQLFVTS